MKKITSMITFTILMATQAHAHEVVSAGGFVTGLTHPVL